MKEFLVFTFGILRGSAPLIISGVAIWLTSRYQKHAKKLANDKMMKELFTEFNHRYDKLNNGLIEVLSLKFEDWRDLDHETKSKNEGFVIDFFNLCAEEYFWHKEGRINGNIWASWSKGMNDLFNKSKVIQNLWEIECNNEGYKSYYIESKSDFFKNA